MAGQEQTILLLEDDEATRELYRRELGRRYRVVCSDSVGEAMAMLRRGELHALVLEPAWASDSGWQLMEGMRELPEGQRVPIVIVTVLDERRQAFYLGAAAYSIKPVVPATLLATLERILGLP